MAGIRARGYYMHVPGLANPADIPSRVPFVSGPKGPHLDPTLLQKQKGDVETMEGIHAHSAPTYRALVVPSASELNNAQSFIQRTLLNKAVSEVKGTLKGLSFTRYLV